ncbi:MAG: SMP-30/gluconolactonase/LRE family protein, partial [Methyloceanibacter sp.]
EHLPSKQRVAGSNPAGIANRFTAALGSAFAKEKLMRLVIGLLLTLIATTAAQAEPKLLWETKGLAEPEAVLQDPATEVLYVSNIAGPVMQKDGNGFISKLRPDGTMLDREWVKGLDGPAGLALHGRTLYVADVDQLIEINIASGQIVERYQAEGAIFLNGIVADQEGTVYVSDTVTNTIWRLKDGKFEPWLVNDALNGPNGLLVQDGKLIVASFGKLPSEGQEQEVAGLLAVSLEDQAITPITKEPVGNLDGLALLEPGIYLVSDWASGGVYRIDAKGEAERLLSLRQGSATLAYLPDSKTVLIPIMLNNSLLAYRLD